MFRSDVVHIIRRSARRADAAPAYPSAMLFMRRRATRHASTCFMSKRRGAFAFAFLFDAMSGDEFCSSEIVPGYVVPMRMPTKHGTIEFV